MPKNSYYSSTIEQFYTDKDSVMEMAKIVHFNPERLVARVYTLTSKQYRDEVPVFFPSMYLNTGIITPPVVGSTSLLFWGPDRQPFLLPIQLTVPNRFVEEGISRLSASPGFMDKLLSLKNIQGGELLFRALGNSFLFLKNSGDVELGTSRLHRIHLSTQDGAFNLSNDRIRADVSNSHFYFGPKSEGNYNDLRNHFYFEMSETADNSAELATTDNEELLNNLMNDQLDTITLQKEKKISVTQYGHVFDEEGELVVDASDGTELFHHQVMKKDEIQTVTQLSKGGRKLFSTTNGNRTTTVEISPEIALVSTDRMVNGKILTSEIGIDNNGNIFCAKDGKKYDLWEMLTWFYENR
jgi:hypothetical protein